MGARNTFSSYEGGIAKIIEKHCLKEEVDLGMKGRVKNSSILINLSFLFLLWSMQFQVQCCKNLVNDYGVI